MQILFVSAPFGPFFREAAKALGDDGHSVWRIAWEGGDFVETPAPHRIRFHRSEDDEETFVRRIIREKKISIIVTFNDTSRRNRLAIKIASELGIQRLVLENGYLRPFWITVDRSGVNGFSDLPRDPSYYTSQNLPPPSFLKFQSSMRCHVRHVIWHYFWSCALSPFLRFEADYHGDHIWRQARHYFGEYIWRISHSEEEKLTRLKKIHEEASGPIFVVLLQKPGDSQLKVHSSFPRNRAFLVDVLQSFSANAPSDALLVIKQHPYDYGVERCPRFVEKQAERLGIFGRVVYFRKTSIDRIYDQSTAVITVNSTGGLTALMRDLPVICMGNAVYDMPKLTFQGALDEFWSNPVPPVRESVDAFCAYLQKYSQVNGGFHSGQGIELAVAGLARIVRSNEAIPHRIAVSTYQFENAFVESGLGMAMASHTYPTISQSK
ncbi:Capsule polysaccharide biosynthesis protein [Rhodomicrobium vannielii ATCC 17100]|uniref:Capsule polysaccharide biosynthesis protein n=1 Tax=Rhodomicrobium vannielii (strain ATCC 17100 / DSM 162 / LMG 4299 / NCIMB 10020 / ATH 3.1.1) TaxID=648757 RepID=E3I5F8_RHOVT|nr:capsular biosynthesis protein [Rhodomicrobium vannielii]ADP71679.1 Capsule polysaccharide biosynthesis protein [Rhodomicrobium vannielii ATCC 17100]